MEKCCSGARRSKPEEFQQYSRFLLGFPWDKFSDAACHVGCGKGRGGEHSILNKIRRSALSAASWARALMDSAPHRTQETTRYHQSLPGGA